MQHSVEEATVSRKSKRKYFMIILLLIQFQCRKIPTKFKSK